MATARSAAWPRHDPQLPTLHQRATGSLQPSNNDAINAAHIVSMPSNNIVPNDSSEQRLHALISVRASRRSMDTTTQGLEHQCCGGSTPALKDFAACHDHSAWSCHSTQTAGPVEALMAAASDDQELPLSAGQQSCRMRMQASAGSCAHCHGFVGNLPQHKSVFSRMFYLLVHQKAQPHVEAWSQEHHRGRWRGCTSVQCRVEDVPVVQGASHMQSMLLCERSPCNTGARMLLWPGDQSRTSMS